MHHQRGNILFMILLAVVLFAALSYAVTNSIRGEGKSSSSELAMTSPMTLLQYGAGVENAVNRMVLAGYPIENIDYRSTTTNWRSTTANAACTSSACKLFDQAGGGISPFSLGSDLMKSTTTGQSAIYLIRIDDIGTTNPEVALYVENVSNAACQAINQAVGLGSVIPIESGGDGGGSIHWYSGGSMTTGALHRLGNGDTRLKGQRAFCFSWNNSSIDNAFIYVLSAR